MSSTSRARFSSPDAVSSSSATSLIASSSGQNVIPSPYGRQRPRATVALCSDVLEKLPDEPRLPDSGRAENGEELAGVVADRLLERVVQASPLAVATDHRRREATAPALRRSGGPAGRLVEASSLPVPPRWASRADVVSGSPVARSWSPAASPPVTTAPVLTPIRTSSRAGQSPSASRR